MAMRRRWTIAEAAQGLRDGVVSSAELVDTALEVADELDEQLGTFVSRFDETARESARLMDAELAEGNDRGPLHGIPIGVKDVVATAEGPTRCQSLITTHQAALTGDATVISRLRDAGAIIMGKTSTMEFACGMPDDTKPFPVPCNSWDLDRWSGGSSSGTGNGLSVGMFLGGVASDTCGSGRAPAAMSGVTGFRQTFGIVPTAGSMPLAESMDALTPMARTAWDCGVLLNAMAAIDCTTGINRPLTGLRVGVDRRHLRDHNADPVLAKRFDAAVRSLERDGAQLVDVDIPMFEELTAAALLSFPAEALAFHRGDLQERWKEYGRHTRLALASGALISGADLARAERVRSVGRARVLQLFESVDVVCTPTDGRGAPLLNGNVSAVSGTGYRPIWSAVGFPALSVPMGLGAESTPLGLQIASPPHTDALTLRVGHRYQQATDWHLVEPPMVHRTRGG